MQSICIAKAVNRTQATVLQGQRSATKLIWLVSKCMLIAGKLLVMQAMQG